MAFFLYILRCNDSSYYVGHTDDIDRRLSEHQIGKYCDYTRWRRPVKLVYSESFGSRDEAFAAERRIKNWSRVKKEALINKDWEALGKFAKKKFK